MIISEDEEKIDIVITWVDGNDLNWQAEKEKYANVKGDASVNRFRDFENLQYLFRGIDKYAKWINKVFFVTWGHLPNWLNVDNEKLEIVNHKDFIPKEYLPTFSSNVIEMNLHRINGLSSKFILFNDDLFILKSLKKSDFFEKNLPKDMYIEYKKINCSRRHQIMRKNYFDIINKYFSKREFVKNNIFKIVNFKYGMDNFKSLKYLKQKNFEDIYSPHLTQAFLKDTFNEVWVKEENRLDEACQNKFRADNDVGSQLCRYWQILSGRFVPTRRLGKYFEISNDNKEIVDCIKKQKCKIICINDARKDIDFECAKMQVNSALKEIFSEKCSFEI